MACCVPSRPPAAVSVVKAGGPVCVTQAVFFYISLLLFISYYTFGHCGEWFEADLEHLSKTAQANRVTVGDLFCLLQAQVDSARPGGDMVLNSNGVQWTWLWASGQDSFFSKIQHCPSTH